MNKITAFWWRGGWIGVDLFFVLSGFLISGLLFREYQKTGELDLKRFLIRRGFKIYPAFWALIIATYLVSVFYDIGFYGLGLVGELLFIQNYAPNLWEHTWTLAVEEHFYIGLCVLFYFLIRKGKNADENPFSSVPKIFAFLAIACLLMRFLTVYFFSFQYGRIIEPTHLRLDSLFFGVFISYLWHFRALSENEFLNRRKFSIGFAGLLLLLPAFIFDLKTNDWLGVIGLTMFYSGSGFIMLAALRSDFSHIPFSKTIAYLGTFSYSIYLWNLPAQLWISEAFNNLTGNENWYLYFCVYSAATLILGVGMSKLVEYPILKIRNRHFPTLSPSLAQTVKD